MDIREAIQILRRLMLPAKISYDIGHKGKKKTVERETIKENTEALKMAIEALGKVDRYRWHDAEEELPETSDDVLVYHTYYHVKADCIKGEIETGYMYKGKWHGQAARGIENIIIAWKYIEPYKEESR